LRAEFAGQTFQSVGVFVNRPAEKVNTILKEASLDLAQLHGDEDEADFAQLPGRAFKATNPRTLAEAETAAQRFLRPEPGFILVDAWHPTLRGGTGHVADWSLAGSLAEQVPLLLAGGLTPANVAEAVAQVQPWGVDVSSGVEASKGRKDHAAVRAFVAAAKSS
jgi:phosphoribosylanthranilate isomerase